jgi:hypothetical protein
VMGRPFPGEADLEWHDDDDEGEGLSGHLYAKVAESREQITDFYRRVWAHSDATIEELPLDASGTVPWWPEEGSHPTLYTPLSAHDRGNARHAGDPDIIRDPSTAPLGARGCSFGACDTPRVPSRDGSLWSPGGASVRTARLRLVPTASTAISGLAGRNERQILGQPVSGSHRGSRATASTWRTSTCLQSRSPCVTPLDAG